jgi:ABC-type sugar transport system permease subunit
MNSNRRRLFHVNELLWFAPAFLLLFAVVLYPVMRTLALSFAHKSLATGFQTEFAGLANFARLAVDSRFTGERSSSSASYSRLRLLRLADGAALYESCF